MSDPSASTLIALQIGARVFTFVFNQILVRLVSPTIFGLANIQLELLLSTILFLSREAIRNVLLRSGRDSKLEERRGPRNGVSNSVHNISLLPIPIGLLLTSSACALYVLYLSPREIRQVDTFNTSVFLYGSGALIELFYEPLHIRALALGHASLRVKAEGVAVTAKCLVTIFAISTLPKLSMYKSLQRDERGTALLAFGLGQLAYGAAMLGVHAVFFLSRYQVSQTLDLYVPRPESTGKGQRWLDRQTLMLCAEMSKQSILKHGLTEADKLAIAKFASLEDQGGYALASNYGSLVARILFQPVEETARLVFSRNLSPIEDSYEQKSAVTIASLDKVTALLSALFRLQFLLGAMLLTFGSPLSVPFLHVLAGPRWAYQTSASAILGSYTAYLPIMGINGLVEGFFQSTASQSQVARYNTILFLASVIFVCTLASPSLFAHLAGSHANSATTSMVWANAASLLLRAVYCWTFLMRYVGIAAPKTSQGNDIMNRVRPATALPSKVILVVFGVMAIALRVLAPRLIPSEATVFDKASSSIGRLGALRLLAPVLTTGLTGVLVCLISIVVFERRELSRSFRSIRGSRSHAKTE